MVIYYVLNKSDFDVENGYIKINTKLGLGVEIDEYAVRGMAKIGRDWKKPVWRNGDGSFSEW